jgi:hypothetical protein
VLNFCCKKSTSDRFGDGSSTWFPSLELSADLPVNLVQAQRQISLREIASTFDPAAPQPSNFCLITAS